MSIRVDRSAPAPARSEAGQASTPPPPPGKHPSLWRTSHLTRLVILDAISIWIALTGAASAPFGVDARRHITSIDGISYGLVVALIAGGWMISLSSRGAYESRFYGTGPEEYKRVIRATVVTFGFIAIVSYGFKLELPRSFVAVALPLGLVLLLTERYFARQWLIRRREQGLALNRVVAVGDETSVIHLQQQLHREPYAGYDVVAGCPAGRDVLAVVRAAQADTVAVTASRDMTPARLRELAWSLEGTGVDLIVAPSLVDVAGPRITVNPVGGLPLLHVDEPQFTGWRRIVKHSMDRAAAVLGLVLLSPLLVGLALAVRMTSPGPALFRQLRVGGDGKEFRVYKFRTMHEDAGAQLTDLQTLNETDGLLFKIKDDPRVTRIGRLLRRTSMDELPQLLNVLLGHMSLVGPRPLPVAEGDFEGHVRRRLLVRPGITGLWQVSGRSTLSWDDTVRLDLYYVENWSLTMDFMILARTVRAVARGSGAY